MATENPPPEYELFATECSLQPDSPHSRDPFDLDRRHLESLLHTMPLQLFQRVYIVSRKARGLPVRGDGGNNNNDYWGEPQTPGRDREPDNSVQAQRLGVEIGFPPGYPWYNARILKQTDYLYDNNLSPAPVLEFKKMGLTFSRFVNILDELLDGTTDPDEMTLLPPLETVPPFEFVPGPDHQYYVIMEDAIANGPDRAVVSVCLRYFEHKIRETMAKQCTVDELVSRLISSNRLTCQY
jgi:hypothetical protein